MQLLGKSDGRSQQAKINLMHDAPFSEAVELWLARADRSNITVIANADNIAAKFDWPLADQRRWSPIGLPV
jgi:hypothetical protein